MAGEICANLGGDGGIGFHALSVRTGGTVQETHAADGALHHWLSGLGYSYDTANIIVNTPASVVRWRPAVELRNIGIQVDPYP